MDDAVEIVGEPRCLAAVIQLLRRNAQAKLIIESADDFAG